MAIVAALPGHNLFSTLPTTSSPLPPSSSPPPKPPIPIPKYPPPKRSQKRNQNPPPPPPPRQHAFKKHHHRDTKYYKPVKDGQVIAADGDRSVVVGESGVSYRLPGAPFEFQFSYSETPKAKPLAIREPAFLPFAPPTMPRPWTGKAPMKKNKQRNIKLFEAADSSDDDDDEEEEEEGDVGLRKFEMLKAYELGKYMNVNERSRKEVLGKPLTREEIEALIRPHLSSNKQVNLGRDGLTHNMLELIHTHWRRQPVCKVRCLGVPTVDMNNLCRCLEEKTGGKIIRRLGGVVYLFRGRNYDHQTRPRYPVMLWKPATPVYPKLIQEAPEGLTKEEAIQLRTKGKSLLPICKLAKNGVYVSLVKDVKHAFEGCSLVKIDCKGMHASDYKKIGAKLKELVPCVLLSFDDEQILIWRGKDWKSMYSTTLPAESPDAGDASNMSGDSRVDHHKHNKRSVSSSPKMMSLWQRAIDSGKALLLDEPSLPPDDLLEKVEEFANISQVAEHSYPALILSTGDSPGYPRKNYEGSSEDEDYTEDEADDENYPLNNSSDLVESSAPLGSLPVDLIVKQLTEEE